MNNAYLESPINRTTCSKTSEIIELRNIFMACKAIHVHPQFSHGLVYTNVMIIHTLYIHVYIVKEVAASLQEAGSINECGL